MKMNSKTEQFIDNIKESIVYALNEIPEAEDCKPYGCIGVSSELPGFLLINYFGEDLSKNKEESIKFMDHMSKVFEVLKLNVLKLEEYELCECGKDRNTHEPKLKDNTLFCGYCGKKLIRDGGGQNGL